MTEEQQDRLDDIINDSAREHFYSEDGRAVVRLTTTACGYKISTNVITNGDEQLDIPRAQASLDDKEENYLAKLLDWGKIS